MNSPAPSTENKRHFERWRIISVLMMAYDFVAIHAAYYLALWVRFDCRWQQIPRDYLNVAVSTVTIYALVCVAVLWVFRLYHSLWRYVGYADMVRTVSVSLALSVGYTAVISFCIKRMPLSYYVWGAFAQLFLLVVVRFAYRVFVYVMARHRKDDSPAAERVMIIGAGNAGQTLAREMVAAQELDCKVVCFIDDDVNKQHRYIDGIPVVGGRDDILLAAKQHHISQICFAIPSADAQTRREILNVCNETGCKLKQLPGLYQIVLGQLSVSSMKNVSVEDLLGREPVKTDLKEVFEFINGKVVLVTGGGGSIGSELCRQIAAHDPATLIIFDIYENNAYAIQLELRKKYPNLNLVTLIGSVRDSRRIFQVFEIYHPDIVYHAAAHKHVPLMEDSPNESIKNNVFGTYKTAYAAMVNGCKRFVLISTDKAVNPTNIMGASKRLCEMVIQSFNTKIAAGKAYEIPELFTHEGMEKRLQNPDALKGISTEFVAVRFGNVLGSNGSVVPLFKKQIEEGGPVTVTHPDIIRYFMTIPEAVSLVLQAGTYAHGGEIFVLDMGSPVKIDTLARNLIRLSGYKPDVDIKIEYTGLRPGEKLYEEKLMAEEGLKTTANTLIHIGCPIPFETDEFLSGLEDLMLASYRNKSDIRERVAKMVSTYHYQVQDGHA